MTIDLEKKLDDLKKLNESKDKLNNKIISQLLNEQEISETLSISINLLQIKKKQQHK